MSDLNNVTKSHELRPRLAAAGLALALTFWGVRPWFSGEGLRPALLAAAGVLVLLALLAPQSLIPLARVMHFFATWLTRLVGWLALVIAFWCVVTPAGLLMRLGRRDPLLLRFDPQAESYWEPSGQSATSLEELRRQF